ncbi:hypothetical protein BGZ76_003820, partial [Entomortierella beljakovae]
MEFRRWLILLLAVLVVCHAQIGYEYFGNATIMKEIRDLNAELAKLGQEFDRQNSTIVRTNGVKAAASSSSNLNAYCVGYNADPPRVKVFRDREDCDISGWNTFMTFW